MRARRSSDLGEDLRASIPQSTRQSSRLPELVWPGKRGPHAIADERQLELRRVARFDDRDAEPLFARQRARDTWQNLLVWGDNADAMRALAPRFGGKIDLVYIDPPFGTGQDYAVLSRGRPKRARSAVAYRDKWGTGAAGFGEYLAAMLDRLHLCRDLLADAGTIFVHCDWHVSHWMRCLLDEVFGIDAFKNEVVWRYRRWPARTRVFQRMHDVLFWYGKTPNEAHTFHPRYERLAESTLKTWGTKRQIADFSSGRRKPSQTDDESPGAPLSDVWDIGIIAPISKERCGYPTQKPEALLRRVIECTTNPGDLVLDAFCGSGTTLAAAEKLGRRWIGCDVGRVAIQTATRRLRAVESSGGARGFELHVVRRRKARR